MPSNISLTKFFLLVYIIGFLLQCTVQKICMKFVTELFEVPILEIVNFCCPFNFMKADVQVLYKQQLFIHF